MCFDFLYKFCLKYSSFYEEFARYYHQCTNVCVLITNFPSQTLLRIEFSRQIFENPQISNFMEILPVGTELLRVDGRIDTDRLTYLSRLIVAFRSFANSLETLKYGFSPVVSPKAGLWTGQRRDLGSILARSEIFLCFLLRLDEFWGLPSFLPFV
jgi:hypothetical protein